MSQLFFGTKATHSSELGPGENLSREHIDRRLFSLDTIIYLISLLAFAVRKLKQNSASSYIIALWLMAYMLFLNVFFNNSNFFLLILLHTGYFVISYAF